MDSTMVVIFILVIFIGAYIILNRSTDYESEISNQETQDPFLQRLEVVAKEFLSAFSNLKRDYFRVSDKNNLIKKYSNFFLDCRSNKKYVKNKQIGECLDIAANIDKLVNEHNREYVMSTLNQNKAFFDNIDGKSLDEQQRKAVIVDEDQNFIIAGAGSGKTLTIAAKVKYLTSIKKINPENILLISFTRKSAEEMHERVFGKLNIPVGVKTFHKLGLDIISVSQKRRPDVFDDIDMIIRAFFHDELKEDSDLKKKVLAFIGSYFAIPSKLDEAENLGDVIDKDRQYDLESLKSKYNTALSIRTKNHCSINNERMKSVQEVLIANYLFLHGVKYTYEKPYPYENEDLKYKHYRPDFYLDDYDIYLEHFGITKDNKVPWLSPIDAKKYLDSIAWKRWFHNKNKTKLIETYSYNFNDGNIYEVLDKMLAEEGVKYQPIDINEIYKLIVLESKDPYSDQFNKLVKTFLNLFKSRGFGETNFDDLYAQAEKADSHFFRNRYMLFIDIIKRIFLYYEKYLHDNMYIDFNDMINQATAAVREGKYKQNYKYILIDEYQDISFSRFKLIDALRHQSDARIIAVGDDWQSIYRFTGSDLNLLSNYKKFYGYGELLKIEKTYRNSQELVNIASKFIMKNSAQIKKNLVSDKRLSNPVRIIGYVDDISTAVEKALDNIVKTSGEHKSIMILGRHNFDVDSLVPQVRDNSVVDEKVLTEMRKKLELSADFVIDKNKNRTIVLSKKYPKLKIEYYTVHKSKGLEADCTIIINQVNHRFGFPNQMEDDPLLSMVLTDNDNYPYSEERRLFYVALTRTRESVHLIVPVKNQSVFAKEIIQQINAEYRIDTREKTNIHSTNCPVCKTGKIVVRENPKDGKPFVGCTNYPGCNFHTNKVEIINKQIICNICGSFMIKRSGRYGNFYGCLNYPDCTNSFDVEKDGIKSNRFRF